MDELSRDELMAFISHLESDLTSAFESASRFFPFELRQSLFEAWQEVRARQEFSRMEILVRSGRFDVALDDVGLSGSELVFKLQGVTAARPANIHQAPPRRLRRWL